MRFILVFVIISFLHSCSNIEFVYNNENSLTNPLYENTKISTAGFDLVFLKSYIPTVFGNTKNEKFDLLILVQEKKIRRSVETNQAVSNLRHELRFSYELKSLEEGCVIVKKEILSSFSTSPKSSGYNYGTDVSLEKKYELAISENINRFISYLSSVDLKSCL